MDDIGTRIDRLLALPPYSLPPEEHQTALLGLLKDELDYAGHRNPAVRNYLEHWPVSVHSADKIARGEVPALPAGSPLAVIAAGPGGVPGSAARPLTRREREIAGLVADGLGNREIAGRLFLSKRTVDSHIEHIFAKLSFSSRAQLAGWFRDQGQAGSPARS